MLNPFNIHIFPFNYPHSIPITFLHALSRVNKVHDNSSIRCRVVWTRTFTNSFVVSNQNQFRREIQIENIYSFEKQKKRFLQFYYMKFHPQHFSSPFFPFSSEVMLQVDKIVVPYIHSNCHCTTLSLSLPLCSLFLLQIYTETWLQIYLKLSIDLPIRFAQINSYQSSKRANESNSKLNAETTTELSI